MKEWRKVKLGELIDSISKTYKFNEERVFFLNTSDTLEGKVINHSLFDPKDLPGQAKKSFKKFDILYSEIRPANKRYAYIDFNASNYVASTKLMVLRPKPTNLIDTEFLFHFLTSKEIIDYLQIQAESRSGTFPQIRFEEISQIEINLPPISKQTAIAEILSSLDDKIELNNQINQNLEALAQALFKQWFVDFEFPNENGEPYKSSGGEMVDSELGEIPKGWRIGAFGDLCKVINGYAFKSKDFKEYGENGIIKIRNVSGNIVDINNTQFVTNTVTSNVQDKFKVLSGDILIAMTGAEVGKIGVVPETKKSLWLNQRVGKLKPLINNSDIFIYTMYNIMGISELVKNSAMGSAQPNISASGIESLKFIIPFQKTISDFSSIFKNTFDIKLKNMGENQNLEILRDTILPKLISGELEVKEAMEQIS